ncbi:MAG: hypothetical protein IH862_01630 [Chloroflexi bacterium]|nr:hypothetical protein [Chloroflexota bacterium]
MFVIGAAALALALVHVACGSQASVVPSPTSLPTTASSTVGNTPSFPGANLLINVVDEQGQPVTDGTIEVSVENEGAFDYLDFNYSVNLATFGGGGLLGIHPPPRRHLAKMLLQVVTLNGKRSDTLVVRNDDFWEAVDPDRDYVAAHTFDLGKTGKVSELVYPKPTERAPSNQRNVPSVPGNAVLISVIGEQGLPVEEGTIEISVENQVVPQWDFAYSVDLSSVLPDGLLSLFPPSGRVPSTVSIQVVTQTGEASDTLVIGGNEFWQAVVATDLDYVAVHQFDLAKSGTTSSVIYITEPQP